jgi:hypothetical protein
MMVHKPDRTIRRSLWPPGNLLPPDLCVGIHRRHGSHFRWYASTRTHALLHSIHLTIGGTE